MLRQFKQAQQWLQHEVWNDGEESLCSNAIRVPLAAVFSFQRNECVQKAAALTFSTLLAFIPLLAIMFALLKGLGVHNTIEPLLLKHLSVGSEEVVPKIIGYINNTNVGRLGSVGLVMLVFTVLALISNIEKSFNSLWSVNETRSLFRRFADYFSVVTLGPLFLLAAISMNTSLRNQHLVQWLLDKPVFGDMLLLLFEVLPFVVIWAAFIFLYMFIPNTKVNIIAAIIGGVSAGTLWLITQWGYVTFQYGVAKYNAIYGTMAALPIFMIWVYLSWMIALLGLQVCWAHQNRKRLGRLLWRQDAVSWQPLQVLEILLLVYNRFVRGEHCWSVEDLLEQLDMPRNVAQEVIAHLQEQGVLMLACEETSERDVVVPTVPLDALDLRQVLSPKEKDRILGVEVANVAGKLHQIRKDYIATLSLTELVVSSDQHNAELD